MRKTWILLFALAASALMMTACGRNRNDADTNSVQHTEQYGTDRTKEKETETTETTDDGGILSDAEDMVSDVIDEGGDVVSEAVEGGRDIVSDIAGTEMTTTETTHTSR